MLLPVHALGKHYRVMSYEQAETPALEATAGAARGVGRLLIVGTQPGTSITFRTSRTSWAVTAGVLPTLEPLRSINDIVLNDGDVFQAYSTTWRGLEFLMGYYGILDRAPKGRDEGEAWQLWIRRHDEYETDG